MSNSYIHVRNGNVIYKKYNIIEKNNEFNMNYTTCYDKYGNKFEFRDGNSLNDLPSNIQVILDLALTNSEMIEVFIGQLIKEVTIYEPHIDIINQLKENKFENYKNNESVWHWI